MHHGCYKLCPKVREQLRKAAESGEGIADIDGPSYERIEVAAGPSRAQKLSDPLGRRRSKNGIDYSSIAASPKKRREKRENPSYESVRSRDRERRKQAHWDESDESLQKEERGRGKDGKSQGSSEKRGKARTTLTKRDERRYNDESANPSRTRKRDAEYTSGRETLTKSSGARRKLASNEKIHKNRRGRTERPEHRGVEQSIRTNVRQQSEGREKNDAEEAGPSRVKGERKRDRSTESSNDERPYDRHDNCKFDCRGINEKVRKMKDTEQQEAFDEYIINKTLSYFEDLCNCHYACLVDQLSKDSFVTSTIASAIIFAIGVKLCSEMDGWRITF